MIVLGIDFTSAPTAKKPITAARSVLDGRTLRLERVDRLESFDAFERLLAEPGPWVMGLDFPFAQSRRFVEDQGWPLDWRAYVRAVEAMGAQGFFELVKAYEAARPAGAKQPRRAVDRLAGGQPPQKVQWQPVGLMFAQGAPRLLASGVHVPLLAETGDARVALEVYPGVLARALVGRRSYKAETADDPARRAAREALVEALRSPALEAVYGLRVALDEPSALVSDAKGDELDAVLAAVQTAWASRQPRFGIPEHADPVEGWISDPHLVEPVTA